MELNFSEVLQSVPKPRIPRNVKCPCGSGKKYKKCCGFKEKKVRQNELLLQYEITQIEDEEKN